MSTDNIFDVSEVVEKIRKSIVTGHYVQVDNTYASSQETQVKTENKVASEIIETSHFPTVPSTLSSLRDLRVLFSSLKSSRGLKETVSISIKRLISFFVTVARGYLDEEYKLRTRMIEINKLLLERIEQLEQKIDYLESQLKDE